MQFTSKEGYKHVIWTWIAYNQDPWQVLHTCPAHHVLCFTPPHHFQTQHQSKPQLVVSNLLPRLPFIQPRPQTRYPAELPCSWRPERQQWWRMRGMKQSDCTLLPAGILSRFLTIPFFFFSHVFYFNSYDVRKIFTLGWSDYWSL